MNTICCFGYSRHTIRSAGPEFLKISLVYKVNLSWFLF